jgi:hypothetical protein
MNMRWTAAVTFETPDSGPPDTVRTVVRALDPSTAASRAIKVAKKQRRRKSFESLVVLLQRAEPEPVEVTR